MPVVESAAGAATSGSAGAEGLVGTALPGGRRRRVAGGRSRVVKVRVSAAEEAWLLPRAAAVGVSVQRLLVESAMAGGPVPAAERRGLFWRLQAAARDVHGVAVNVNQMARWGNENRLVPEGWETVVARFEAAQGELLGLAAEAVGLLDGAAPAVHAAVRPARGVG